MKNDDIRNKIVTHYAGSHAYGTNTPTSDVDIRGIFCADKIQIVTPFFPIREVTVEDQEDSKLFEVRNYLKLYLDANPNILETLWVPDDKIIETTQEYELLKQHRQSLLSSKVAFTYSGYAVAQMKRLVNHHKHQSSMWILLELATAVKHALDNNDIDINWVFTRYGTDFLGFCGFSTDQTDYKIVDIEQNTKHDIAKYALHATMDQFVKFEKPVRSDFLTILHNYTNNNKSKVSDFRYDHALIPYGSNIYAVVKFTGESLYNNDGSIRTLSITSSDMFKLPVQCLVKLNESSYNDACSWVDKYWSWYNGRNAVRAEMERKYGYDCYSHDTEFLTESGFKLFDDITSDDKLATFDENGSLSYHNYTERFDSLYTGNLYHYTGTNYDCLVTANHQMVYRPYERNNTKPKHEHFIKNSAANLPECYQFRATINPVTKVYKMCSELQNIPDGLSASNYIALMGWYLSDGTCRYRYGKVDCVAISQSKNSKLMQNAIKMANRGLLKRYKGKITTGGFTENLFIAHRDTSIKLVGDCGHGSSVKRIPPYMFTQSKRLMKMLLINMLHGDGTKIKLKTKNDVHVYYTNNSLLADDVQRLAILCGFVSAKWGPYITESNYGTSAMYQVHINMSPSPYKTMVNRTNLEKLPVTKYRTVCFTVPNNTLVTRRNGKIAMHGNCKFAMHLVRLLRTADECLSTGIINVYRQDAQELLAIRNGAWTYNELIEYTEYMDNRIKELYKQTFLPKVPDVNLAAKVLMQVQDSIWSNSSK